MKKALISPNEKVRDNEGNVIGSRIAETKETTFEVAPPLFWADCPDECETDTWYYSITGEFSLKP